ncbi:hypothetical protein D3C71_1251050 [compost metagenome]
MASRIMACWIRLARNPGTSRLTCTGFFLTCFMMSVTWATTASLEYSLRTTSTAGTRWAGMKKCNPIMRSRVLRPSPMALIGRLDELLVSGTCAGDSPSSSAKIACLSANVSGAHSMTRATPCHWTSRNAARGARGAETGFAPMARAAAWMRAGSKSRVSAAGSTI